MRLSAAPPPLAATKRDLALRVRQLALELAALVDDGRKPLDHFVRRDLEQLGRLAHTLVLRREIAPRGIAGQRLDAADAGGDRALADDLEQADIAGAPDMGAAAELDRISVAGPLAVGVDAHRDDANLIAIFLAEQRQRAFGDGLVGRHQMRLDRSVLQDHGIDQILDRADLLMRHWLLMREIEA